MGNWQERMRLEREEDARRFQEGVIRRKDRLNELANQFSVDNVLSKVLEEWKVGEIFGSKIDSLGYNFEKGVLHKNRVEHAIPAHLASDGYMDLAGTWRSSGDQVWVPEQKLVNDQSSLFQVYFHLEGPDSIEWIEVLDYIGDESWNHPHILTELEHRCPYYSRPYVKQKVSDFSAQMLEEFAFQTIKTRTYSHKLPFEIHPG